MLQGKSLLVTGSSRGIGAAVARLAKARGARVVLHGKTESVELKKLSADLDAPYVFFDVADESAAHEAIRTLGSIDILVNNAGINPSKTFAALSITEWREVFETNVLGIVIVSKAVIPGMLERHYGRIIHVASVKGFPYVPGKPAYAASKAAVMRITSSMAEEFSPHILVNAIAPGFTETEMTSASLSPQVKQQMDSIPLRRLAKPEDIAEAVLFFASDASRYITGQTLAVDGGWSVT